MRFILLLLSSLLGFGSALAQEPPPAPVVIDRVSERSGITTTVATGTVHGRRSMQITAAVAGRVLWLAEPGDDVEAGSDIARIDTQPLLLQRAEQQAMMRRAQIQLDYLQRELERRERLGASDMMSEWELEQTRAQRDMARSDREIARIRVQQLDDQISRAIVKAPFAGQISGQRHFAGEEVPRGAILAQLNDTEELEVRAQLPLHQRTALRRGGLLSVRAGEQQFVGTIRTILATADRTSQTFEVRASLPSAAVGVLTLGQMTAVELPLQDAGAGLLVPRDALIFRRDGTYVFRVTDAGQAERLEVKVGAGQGARILVKGALHSGDAIAVRGAERLQPGQQVEIIRDLSAEAG